jgi:hypothetical protein
VLSDKAKRKASYAERGRAARLAGRASQSEAHNYENWLGATGRGKMVSAQRAHAAVGAYFAYDNDGKIVLPPEALDEDARLRAAASFSGLDLRTVKKVVGHFRAHREVVLEDTSQRGAGSANYHGPYTLAPGLEATLTAFLEDCRTSSVPEIVTMRRVRQFLLDHGVPAVSNRRAGALVAKLGYKYQTCRRLNLSHGKGAALWFKRFFALQIDAAIKAKAELLSQDESYIGQDYQHSQSIVPIGNPRAAWIRPGRGGDRLCFSEIVGRRGLLVELKETRANVWLPYAHVTGDLIQDSKSAGRYFYANGAGKTGDYHGNFNGQILLETARAQWISAIKHHCPTGKVVLMLDNAPYHASTTPCFKEGKIRFNPHHLGRQELCEQLRAFGCKQLIVAHTYDSTAHPGATKPMTVMLNKAEWDRRGKQGSVASIRELQDAALAWLVEHKPTVLMNDLEALFEEKFQGRVRLAWTPPYCPELAPIELIWAQAKLCAGIRNSGKSTRAEMLEDILEGLYTATAPAPHITDIHGGHFVPEEPGGRCPSAEKVWDHVLRGNDGGFERLFRADKALKGPIGELMHAPGLFPSTDNLHIRAVLRYRVLESVKRDVGDAFEAEEVVAVSEGADDDVSEDED